MRGAEGRRYAAGSTLLTRRFTYRTLSVGPASSKGTRASSFWASRKSRTAGEGIEGFGCRKAEDGGREGGQQQ